MSKQDKEQMNSKISHWPSPLVGRKEYVKGRKGEGGQRWRRKKEGSKKGQLMQEARIVKKASANEDKENLKQQPKLY